MSTFHDASTQPPSDAWTNGLVRTIVFAVAVAAVLGIGNELLSHRDRLVRLEVNESETTKTLNEMRGDLKQLIAAENHRSGREDVHSGRDGVQSGSSSSSSSNLE